VDHVNTTGRLILTPLSVSGRLCSL